MTRHLGQGLLLGLGAAAFALLLAWGGGLQTLEAATWGWRVGHFARGPQGATPIVIIALDQQSLDWGRRENGLSWPWPREAYVPLLDFCRRGGARAVAFDLLFSEDSVYGVDDDRALAAG
jgi:adenylate cyclase